MLPQDDVDFSTDFGRLVYKQPTEILSSEDVVLAFKKANKSKKSVAIRGSGHSCNAQTLTTGTLIHNKNNSDLFGSQIQLLENSLVLTPTCVTWNTLEKVLNKSGLSSPVLTDFLDTTIGGTLSVGGIGTRSFRYGAQIDQVVKLKLIMPNGKTIWCSAEENSEFFQYSLAGMGTIGFIESVIMKTIPYRPFSTYRSKMLFKNSPATALSELKKIAFRRGLASWAHLIYIPKTQDLILEHGQEYEKSEKNQFTDQVKDHHHQRFQKVSFYKKELFYGRNLWCDYILEHDQAHNFLTYIEELRASSAVFMHLSFIYFLVIKRPTLSPLLPLHPAPKKNRFYISIGLYFCLPTEKDLVGNSVQEIKNLFHQLLNYCIQLNGRPYLYGINELNDLKNKSIFGKAYDQLMKLKNISDPNDIISKKRLWGK